MSEPDSSNRRALLQRIACGLSLGALARATSSMAATAEPPLLNEQDPAAQAVHYVEDASRAQQAQAGANCSNCSIYSASGDTEGSCTLFKGKRVKAAGWCSSWSGL